MIQRLKKSFRSSVPAILLLCLLLGPTWAVAVGVYGGWFQDFQEMASLAMFVRTNDLGDKVNELASFTSGSLVVGFVFLAACFAKDRAPSPFFALILPALGLVGVTFSDLFQLRSQVGADLIGDYLLGGVDFAYIRVPFITLPMAFAQTLLMRLLWLNWEPNKGDSSDPN